MELIKAIFEILKKNPQLIIELIKFVLELLEKGTSRQQIANLTATQFNLPIDKVSKVVDLIIKNKNKAKFLF